MSVFADFLGVMQKRDNEIAALVSRVRELEDAGNGVIINAVEGPREGDGWVSVSRHAYDELRAALAPTQRPA